MSDRDKAIVRAFYRELEREGLIPNGFWRWKVRDARRFARAIAEKAKAKRGQA